jgi:hypothetical protein
MWILWTLLVIFFIAACAFGYACYNMVKKIETYEEWLGFFRGEVDEVYNRMKAVDDRNLFEKDDDVGFVFTELVRISKEFNERIK